MHQYFVQGDLAPIGQSLASTSPTDGYHVADEHAMGRTETLPSNTGATVVLWISNNLIDHSKTDH